MKTLLSEAEMTKAEFEEHKFWSHPGNIKMGRAVHAAAHESRTFDHEHLPRLVYNEEE